VDVEAAGVEDASEPKSASKEEAVVEVAVVVEGTGGGREEEEAGLPVEVEEAEG
jgi:hypothetical protein